jgi:hypothetical protein
MRDIEPLPAEIWFRRIAMIASGDLKDTERALRHAFHMLQLTPREFRPPEYWDLDEESYEALLDAGELEAAARKLVSAPTLTVTTAPSASGTKVVIGCKVLKTAVSGDGDSAAAAILQAWANCLLALKSERRTNWNHLKEGTRG